MKKKFEDIRTCTKSSVYKKYRINEIMNENGACRICIRRLRGRIKKYKTYC